MSRQGVLGLVKEIQSSRLDGIGEVPVSALPVGIRSLVEYIPTLNIT